MKILSIEQSTPICSMALLSAKGRSASGEENGSVLAEKNWQEDRSCNQALFTALPELLEKAHITPADIDIFAAGLGPGSFSGLRISISAIRAMALPGNGQVCGVSSGEALAWDICDETGFAIITVVGNARRNSLWFAHFKKTNNSLEIIKEYSLVGIDEIQDALTRLQRYAQHCGQVDGSIVVSPDWDLIGEHLKRVAPPDITFINEKRTPRAVTVGKLALDRINNRAERNLSPIYLHPPVFVEPKCI